MEIDGGDHARANATFLTGAQARKTAGADVELGISVDQIAAGHVGNLTRLPSLELTCDKPRQAATSRDKPRQAATSWQLRFRLQLHLSIQYFLEVENHTDDAGTQST